MKTLENGSDDGKLPSIYASTSSVYAMLSVYTVLVYLSTSTPRVENLAEDTSLKEVGVQEDFSGAISTKAQTQKKSNFGSRKTPSKRS